jgi:hypothetical protein
MLTGIYNQMLAEFGDSLEQISVDTVEQAHPEGRGVFMTSCQKEIVNFDKFKEYIAAKYAPDGSPSSCDGLYMRADNEWYLIEFKNGKIDEKEIFKIRRKIFESLLLLLEKLDKTIAFSRENLTFVLVYNKMIARIEIAKSLDNLSKKHDYSFTVLNNLKKLYLKEVFFWKKDEFESNFIKQYCNQ